MNKSQAQEKIKALIEKYEYLKSAGLIKSYNEANTRKNFILPLFQTLGWDIQSEEVTEEEKASMGRVDYAFRIGNIPKFFLEAKSLKANLDDPRWSKQVINYAWNKGVVWAVLTDFEELKIFNAEEKNPKPIQFSYKEYLTRFDDFWLLSKESFEKGLLDDFAQKWGIKKEKTPVGKQLAKDLTAWREDLTKYFRAYKKVSKEQPDEEIDEAVQRFLDRLIFIRVCEDKEIEPQTLLPLLHDWQNKGRKTELIHELSKLFRQFDSWYDSQLFEKHFSEELETENTPLENLIEGLYGTKDGSIRYDFSAIDADVLGNVYEQYLGAIQRRTGEKDSKRKKQGIYYTPNYIVNYIIQNTLGEILKEKSLQEVKQLKILDPACGSGSFLIKAFEVLDRYLEKNGSHIDFARRAEILINNIYGVDLDPKAVEIAQLNLLLQATQRRTLLPKLTHNIRCGNSLISDTEKELEKYFGKNWQEQKPFNWEEEFKEVFLPDEAKAKADDQRGFDVVIGNPPYVRPHNLDEHIKRYLWSESLTVKAKGDLYAAFIEQGIKLLKEGGLVSFIVPHTWLSLESFEDLRKFILDHCNIKSITSTPSKVFKGAQVETLIFVFQKCDSERKRKNNIVSIFRMSYDGTVTKIGSRKQSFYYTSKIFDTSIGSNMDILEKIDSCDIKLGNLVEFFYGLKTADDEKFLTFNPKNQNEYKKLLRRSNFSRYIVKFAGEYVYYKPDLMKKNKKTARPGESKRFEEPKIIIMDIAKTLISTYDDQGYYIKDALILKPKIKTIDLKYIVALINSKLINFYYHQKFKVLSVAKNAFLDLPIIVASKEQQKEISNLVSKMINLQKELQKLPENSSKHDSVKSEIEKIDHKIDQEIYKLYGLTLEEIKIIEGK